MKTNDDKFQESIDFVACHYEHGAFSSRRGWQRITDKKVFSWRRKAVAAAAIFGILAASAFLYTNLKFSHDDLKENEKVETIIEEPVNNKYPVTANLEFTDAPLTEVVAKIEETYGVKISGLPESEFRLTLSYEGTAEDIIETINDLLQINLTIDNSD